MLAAFVRLRELVLSFCEHFPIPAAGADWFAPSLNPTIYR